MSRSNIEWTEETWNPVTGCSHVSEGCRHCYAETLSLRRGWSKKPWTAPNAGENVKIHTDRLGDPLHWKKPRVVFVNSMSDLFHEQVPLTFIRLVFAVMASASQHTFQVLTKRPQRMREIVGAFEWRFGMAVWRFGDRSELLTHHPLPEGTDTGHSLGRGWYPPNVWLGTSCEDQKNADERIPHLAWTPAAVRFLSCEPLLGPISLVPWLSPRFWPDGPPLGWVIAGGESGKGYRPMEVEWASDLRDQCSQYGVPFFLKQDSGPRPGMQGRLSDWLWSHKQMPQRQAVPA